MNRVMLVFDDPKDCRSCPCFGSNTFGTFCGATKHEIKYDFSTYTYIKPSWCPLTTVTSLCNRHSDSENS